MALILQESNSIIPLNPTCSLNKSQANSQKKDLTYPSCEVAMVLKGIQKTQR